ncbi:co-chaperone DjlA [Steroidobacter sp. S1-65]|uniref:Co-chaperone protein DjlA n=1 Tax=Steroidobacter gossypii TaxID=2805490 RepID=A0ABS1X5C0_9GAMM|nr:co-chaperone DjlA [Steroidobacter gossypii]MBM0108409.1 co-chaperone DjlA [Steroidobacter gossypii]
MYWQGKALGALIGGVTAGPFGALFGTFIGHLFDVQAESGLVGRLGGGNDANDADDADAGPTTSIGVQEAFFRATFQVMGHIAKADGRVSENDIRAARAIMTEFQLGEREVQFAIDLFTQGKEREFPLEGTLRRLRRLLSERPELLRMFVQIQLQTALWSGSFTSDARQVMARVANSLGLSPYELVQMEALLRMQQSSRQPPEQQSRRVDKVAQAYEVLGITSSASDAEVTKAYRRLMNQNHPDKLVARGLPESMMKVAEEKTRQVRAAYEVLREARAMR